MKKIATILAVSAIILSFTSCKNSNEQKETSQKIEVADKVSDEKEGTEDCSHEVISHADSAMEAESDTKEAVTRGGSKVKSEGFGRCLQSGCYCKEFEGRGQTCRNCGHAYKKHY